MTKSGGDELRRYINSRLTCQRRRVTAVLQAQVGLSDSLVFEQFVCRSVGDDVSS